MIAAEGTASIERPPDDIIDFVLDLERYMQADTKITRVLAADIDGSTGEVRYAGRVRGIPGPAMVNTVSVERPRRIDFRSKPGTWQHALLGFHGSFVLDANGDTTHVLHREEFSFRPPLKWLAEPLLRRWLDAAMEDEMVRMKSLLETGRLPQASSAPGARPTQAAGATRRRR
jgi:hypothetical protein